MRVVSSTNAPANGAGSGSTVSAPSVIASTTGSGGTPRAAQPAAANRPWRITASCHPPAPSGAAATSSGSAARARVRWLRHNASMAAAVRSRRRAALS